MVLRVEVMLLSGRLCALDIDQAWTGRDLKRLVSEESGFCTCRIELRASSFTVGLDTPMQKIIRWDTPMQKIIRWLRPKDHERVWKKWLLEDYESTLDMKVLDLHEDGICIKCMIEGCVPLVDIFSSLKEIDANILVAARVPLKDVLQARHQSTRRHQLYGHPPVTEYTMFDSQLQSAGYTATDFRSAGFTAQDLSSKYFWRFASTAGEQEWAETCAFFDASALKEAGFNATQLLDACFSNKDLREAGFPECELPWAKPMPKPKSCRSKSHGNVARHNNRDNQRSQTAGDADRVRRHSQALASILRHGNGISRDCFAVDGFVPVSEVLKAMHHKRYRDIQSLKRTVQESRRSDGTPRFEVVTCLGGQRGEWIRATSDHTFDLSKAMPKQKRR